MLIVLDDILENKKLLNSSFLQGLLTKGRHLKISTFICTQSYMKLDRTLRLNATNLIWFQPKNVSEIKRVYDELIRDMSLDQFIKLCNAVYSKSFNLLNLRIGAEPSKYMKSTSSIGLSHQREPLVLSAGWAQPLPKLVPLVFISTPFELKLTVLNPSCVLLYSSTFPMYGN